MELRRLELAEEALGSEREERGSISVAENDRFREGERKEFGEREGRC